MKFAKYLETESIPEWRKAYLNYKGLKKRLKAIGNARIAREMELAFNNGNLHVLDRFRKAADNSDGETRLKPKYNRSSALTGESIPALAVATASITSSLPSHTGDVVLDYDEEGPSTPISESPQTEQVGQDTFLERRSTSGKRSLADTEISSEISETAYERLFANLTKEEGDFFQMLDAELAKIETFYDEKEREARKKLAVIKQQIELVEEQKRVLLESQLHACSCSSQHCTLIRNHYERSSLQPNFHSGNHPELYNAVTWIRKRLPKMSKTFYGTFPSRSGTREATSEWAHPEHHISYTVAKSSIKRAITEFYRSTEMLKNYRVLNHMGCIKILKKFDKVAGWRASTIYTEKVDTYAFVQSKKLDEVIRETENIYIDKFAGGQRPRGMDGLRLPKQQGTYHFASWRIGIYMGLSIPTCVRLAGLVLDPATSSRLPSFAINLQIYACFVIPLLFCLGFGVNLAVWSYARINYRFIFEFNPRDTLNFHQFFELPSLFLLLLIHTMYFDFSEKFSEAISSQMYPLIYVGVATAILLCPFPVLYYSSRRWLVISLARVFASGFFRIEFRDFFIGDELNSLSYSFWTFGYFICAYDRRSDDMDYTCNVAHMWVTPFVSALPALWRLVQCLRRYHDSSQRVHLVNAGKYLSSVLAMVMVGTNRIIGTPTARFVWIAAASANSIYTSVWDVFMDWDLFRPHSKNLFLRDDLVFRRWIYYVVIITDVLLRFAWIISMGDSKVMSFVTALLEAYRRIQWNIFRLENEHLNNVGHFRAIKDIPLPFNVIPDPRLSIIVGERRPSAVSDAETISSRPASQTVSIFYGRRDFENRREDIDEDRIGHRERRFGV
ncbi:LOW QUALITY PROTEIN: EXS family-domain-containing protein [Jimgerdemannia flammicorona]|uniref:EXS family-domain-containing protein n=1 Tax=Jimgerdemannia flammicorona TaxID=994334 RepID=A0A433BJN6_9FUNG|nr:LOW QUALITY PROTEIN: EXS family-domain-containing protein [Jimgerdemannia flammicorona]